MEGIEGKVFKYVAGCAGGICIDLSSSMSKQLKKVPSNDWQLLGETFRDMLLVPYSFSIYMLPPTPKKDLCFQYPIHRSCNLQGDSVHVAYLPRFLPTPSNVAYIQILAYCFSFSFDKEI